MIAPPTPSDHVPPRRLASKALTDVQLRAARPRSDGRTLKLADGGGLSLWVMPSGKYWRWKYRYGGKEKLLALGVYPEISAREARRRRDEAKRLLSDGVDPSVSRRNDKIQRRLGDDESFAAISREWLALQRKSLGAATNGKAVWTFEQLLFPYVGARPLKEITAPELLAVLRRIEARSAHETANCAKARVEVGCQAGDSSVRRCRRPQR